MKDLGYYRVAKLYKKKLPTNRLRAFVVDTRIELVLHA